MSSEEKLRFFKTAIKEGAVSISEVAHLSGMRRQTVSAMAKKTERPSEYNVSRVYDATKKAIDSRRRAISNTFKEASSNG